MSTAPLSVSEYADQFDVRESVIENMLEEYELEVEAFGIDITFQEYLLEEFAQAHYMFRAIDGGTAVECLEAYDDAYLYYAPDTNNGN